MPSLITHLEGRRTEERKEERWSVFMFGLLSVQGEDSKMWLGRWWMVVCWMAFEISVFFLSAKRKNSKGVLESVLDVCSFGKCNCEWWIAGFDDKKRRWLLNLLKEREKEGAMANGDSGFFFRGAIFKMACWAYWKYHHFLSTILYCTIH